MSEGIEWRVERYVRSVDGDTFRAIIARTTSGPVPGYEHTDRSSDPLGVPLRLAWVDTPERGEPGYAEARGDLTAWILDRGPLRVIMYESAGWDRLLVDLLDENGESASQHMMKVKGWPLYVKGR